jgi:hypothetical protein
VATQYSKSTLNEQRYGEKGLCLHPLHQVRAYNKTRSQTSLTWQQRGCIKARPCPENPANNLPRVRQREANAGYERQSPYARTLHQARKTNSEA